jgi:hypothetical protein
MSSFVFFNFDLCFLLGRGLVSGSHTVIEGRVAQLLATVGELRHEMTALRQKIDDLFRD